MTDDGRSRDWQAPFPLDIRLVLGGHRHGGGDPAFRAEPGGAVWRTSLTPDGPAILRVAAGVPGPPGAPGVSGVPGRPGASGAPGAAGPGPLVVAQAWGRGAGWLLEALPGLLGAADDPSGFRPAHPVLADAGRRHA